MKKKTKKHVHLSELQLALVRVLWARGEATTAEVVAALGGPRGLAHTTIATLLTRLEKRGVLAQRRVGRSLVFRALVSEPEVRSSMVKDLIAKLFQGDPAELVVHLVRDGEVELGDIAKVRARLKESEPRANKHE